jgi:hypothetical protein
VVVRERALDLLHEHAVHGVEMLGDPLPQVVLRQRVRAVEAHEERALQALDGIDDRALVRQRGALEVVDFETALVACEHAVDGFFELAKALRLRPHRCVSS